MNDARMKLGRATLPQTQYSYLFTLVDCHVWGHVVSESVLLPLWLRPRWRLSPAAPGPDPCGPLWPPGAVH